MEEFLYLTKIGIQMKKAIVFILVVTLFSSCGGGGNKKFLGIWHDKGYDGTNNKSQITITKTENGDLLVDCSIWQKIDQYMHVTDGSFKEVGHVKGNSIDVQLNRLVTRQLSLINDTTLLMSGEEFYKNSEHP